MDVSRDTMDVLGVAMDNLGVAIGVLVGWSLCWASQRVSRGGEASDGASPCESREQLRGVLGWWS